MVSTVSPPHALMFVEDGELELVRPSSLQYPRHLKSAASAVVASVGSVVPAAALYTAPLSAGFPALTFPAVFAIYCLLIVSNMKHGLPAILLCGRVCKVVICFKFDTCYDAEFSEADHRIFDLFIQEHRVIQ